MSDTVELCGRDGLDERITILRVGNEVDGVFVRTQRFDALIDTLSTPDLCRQALEKLRTADEARPLVVVNSHMDWDHFWGNAAIAGIAPIIAHASALDRLHDPAAAATLAGKAAQEARFRDVEIVAPTLTFSGPMSLNGGDLTLELLHTPGHTPDHLAVWIPQIRTCLAVDAVEDPLPSVWSDDPQDLRALRASLERLRGLDAETVLPAHGRTRSPEAIARNIAYFDELAARVGRFSRKTLRESDPTTLEGLAFEDLVPRPRPMDAEETQFYHDCHAGNLRATIRSHLETLEIA